MNYSVVFPLNHNEGFVLASLLYKEKELLMVSKPEKWLESYHFLDEIYNRLCFGVSDMENKENK